MIKLESLVANLMGCVATYSDLSAVCHGLNEGVNAGTLTRTGWNMKRDQVGDEVTYGKTWC